MKTSGYSATSLDGYIARADGELRPIVWRFAAPQGGWGARR